MHFDLWFTLPLVHVSTVHWLWNLKDNTTFAWLGSPVFHKSQCFVVMTQVCVLQLARVCCCVYLSYTWFKFVFKFVLCFLICLFSLQIPFLEYFEVRYLIFLFTIVMGLIVLYRNFVVVFTGGIGKNGSTCAVSCLNRFAILSWCRTRSNIFPAVFVGFLLVVCWSGCGIFERGKRWKENDD